MNKKGSIIFVILMIIVLSILFGGFCWTYSINTLLQWSGKAPTIVFWQGALLGLVPGLGQFSVVVASVIWIISLFI